ncbi:MAG TPA: polyphosphate polymerase domain-containing protein [Thermoguttaceae bacterium]|nr:polyphosphate polymerase domain-containing protein [Thermoguttaceae bacterium]
MSYHHKLQASRFELKFIVDEHCAEGVRDFARSYLEVDEYADPAKMNSYPIHSLYCDNSELFLYRQTVCGEKNRFKLRIRFYDDNPDHPAFLEIKRRVTDVIRKERAKVTREGARRILAGHGPERSFLADPENDDVSASAMINFCDLRDHVGAVGCIYVSYTREAYVSPNSDLIRVTFDRLLYGSPYQQGDPLRLPSDGTYPATGNGERVILELKFTDRFAGWMRELVQEFNLQRTSVPKYVHCIDEMGLQSGEWHGGGMIG